MNADTGQEPTATAEPGQEPGEGTKDPAEPGQEPQGKQPDNDKPDTFDREYVEKLRQEAAENRTKASDLQAKLDEKEDAEKSEADKAKAKADRAEARATAAESKLLRHEVASDKKIPPAAVEFLTGSTREELEASADKMLALVGEAGKKSTPDFDGGARQPAPEDKSPEQAHNDLLVQMFTGTTPAGVEQAGDE